MISQTSHSVPLDPESYTPWTTINVEFAVRLGESTMIRVDRQIPLGETTEKTLEHLVELVIKPGVSMASTLLSSHFQALSYAMQEELDE